MIDLLMKAGGDPAKKPSVEQVAEQAGVSVASIFRYFSTLDDLRRHAIQRYYERYDHLLAVPSIGVGSLNNRIKGLVAARCAFYETAESMNRIARHQAAEVGELRQAVDRMRATLTDQIGQHFSEELFRLRAPARLERLAMMAAVTSFETWDQLNDQGLDNDQVARSMQLSLQRLLAE